MTDRERILAEMVAILKSIPREMWEDACDCNDETVAFRAIAMELIGPQDPEHAALLEVEKAAREVGRRGESLLSLYCLLAALAALDKIREGKR